jgi:hypothetical protein
MLMNATSALLYIVTVAFASLPSQLELVASAQSASTSTEKTGKPGAPAKTDSSGLPPGAKAKQMPAQRDPSQAVEERLRSGQMDKPIAQGEISDRLNQLYSGSNHLPGDRAGEHSTR